MPRDLYHYHECVFDKDGEIEQKYTEEDFEDLLYEEELFE